MKIYHIFKKALPACLCIFFSANSAVAQDKGVLPLSGLRYYNEGISAKKMDVTTEGASLLTNKLPLNKEIDIHLQQLKGIKPDNNKKVFVGAEVTVQSTQGQVFSTDQNVLAARQSTGYSEKELTNLSIKFTINNALIKNSTNAIVKIRLYDLKGKNQMRMEMPVVFARPGERLLVSKIVKNINSPEGANAVISGLQAKNLKIMVDTNIKVSPKMAYTSVDILHIKGSSISGIFSGKESFWVYDNNLNEVKVTDMLLKQVKGAMENNEVDYTLKIPYCLKNAITKNYTVRFRWESADKTQVIDIVVPSI